MSGSTLRKKLEALWEAHFNIDLKAARKSWGRTGADHMIDQLEALCQEVAREARLDEQTHTQADIDGNIEYWPDGVTVISQLARIAELTQKPAEETEGQ